MMKTTEPHVVHHQCGWCGEVTVHRCGYEINHDSENLPPLPPSDLDHESGATAFSPEQMQAYGTACWNAALDWAIGECSVPQGDGFPLPREAHQIRAALKKGKR